MRYSKEQAAAIADALISARPYIAPQFGRDYFEIVVQQFANMLEREGCDMGRKEFKAEAHKPAY